VTVSILDAAYALLVAGAAMLWPPLALIVAGLFLVGTWAITDKRTTVTPEAKP
jgi:hypothetical protein